LSLTIIRHNLERILCHDTASNTSPMQMGHRRNHDMSGIYGYHYRLLAAHPYPYKQYTSASW